MADATYHQYGKTITLIIIALLLIPIPMTSQEQEHYEHRGDMEKKSKYIHDLRMVSI